MLFNCLWDAHIVWDSDFYETHDAPHANDWESPHWDKSFIVDVEFQPYKSFQILKSLPLDRGITLQTYHDAPSREQCNCHTRGIHVGAPGDLEF